jgi:hypothetical protein
MGLAPEKTFFKGGMEGRSPKQGDEEDAEAGYWRHVSQPGVIRQAACFQHPAGTGFPTLYQAGQFLPGGQ